MKISLLRLPLVACAIMLTCASPLLHADVPAYVSTGSETDLGAYGLSGVEFSLNLNINLTQLGFTGLAIGGGDTPQVTLWQVGSGGALTQLYTTGNINSSVSSAGPGTQSGVFSYVSVGTPIALSSGNTYLVTAPAYWAATYNSSGVTTAGSGVFTSTSFLTTGPGGWNGWANSAYLGGSPNISSLSAASSSAVPSEANFEFTLASPTSVPEPSTYALLGAGLAFLVLHLRRRRAQVVG